MVVSIRLLNTDGQPYYWPNVDGKPRVSSTPYAYSIAEGDVVNHSPVSVFGHNEAVGTAWESIYHGSNLYTYLTAPEHLKIVANNAQDNSVGPGARTCILEGLDVNFAPINEVITLTGLTPVNTAKSYYRIQGFAVNAVGVDDSNIDDIRIMNQAATANLDSIEAGEGELHNCRYTVPVGNIFYLTQIYASENSTKGTNFGTWARSPGGPWILSQEITMLDQVAQIPLQFPIPIPANTDIEQRCIATIAGAYVTASMFGWIES